MDPDFQSVIERLKAENARLENECRILSVRRQALAEDLDMYRRRVQRLLNALGGKDPLPCETCGCEPTFEGQPITVNHDQISEG